MTIDEWKQAIRKQYPDAQFAAHGPHGWSAHSATGTLVHGVFAIDFGFCTVGDQHLAISTNGSPGAPEFKETP